MSARAIGCHMKIAISGFQSFLNARKQRSAFVYVQSIIALQEIKLHDFHYAEECSHVEAKYFQDECPFIENNGEEPCLNMYPPGEGLFLPLKKKAFHC